MKLTNNSTRMICIASTYIAPGNTAVLDDVWEHNPVIAEYIAKGELAVGEKVKVEEKVEDEKSESKALEDCTKEELKAMAAEQGVDLTGATTKAQIIALMEG